MEKLNKSNLLLNGCLIAITQRSSCRSPIRYLVLPLIFLTLIGATLITSCGDGLTGSTTTQETGNDAIDYVMITEELSTDFSNAIFNYYIENTHPTRDIEVKYESSNGIRVYGPFAKTVGFSSKVFIGTDDCDDTLFQCHYIITAARFAN